MDPLSGRTIKWVFDDGPMAGANIEHAFHADGSVTWTLLDGDYKGATAREKAYAAVKVSERVWVVSYRAASGHTLTVVLNLDDGRLYGFASSDKSWEAMRGRFELPVSTPSNPV
jgi:molybdenum cofactor biosynthesis protein MoaF